MIEGFCECGCGKRTALAGVPARFIRGHNLRLPETRAKLAVAQRGRKFSPETRAKLSAAMSGARHHHWKGGRTKSLGYILVWVSASHPFAEMRNVYGYVYEHRLVLAEVLGRPLSPDEVVHHRNGVKDDNRLSNLELFESGAAHSRHHQESPLCD